MLKNDVGAGIRGTHCAIRAPKSRLPAEERILMNRVLFGGLLAAVAAFGFSSVAQAQVEISGRVYHAAVCPRDNGPGTARCHAHVVTDRNGNPMSHGVSPNTTPSVYAPSDLLTAYNITGSGS